MQSAHTATESTATEEKDDFGYAFVTSGWTPSAEYQETAKPTEGRETSADTSRLAPRTLTTLMDSGTSGHYFDDELRPGLKDKLLNYKPLERPHKILTAGRHVLPGTATGTISGKIIDTDGNKHPVEHAGLVAPGRHNRCLALLLLLLLLLPKLEDKTCEGVLYGYSLNSKAYQTYRNKTVRVTESRNVTFIDTPASTLADSTGGNTTGDAISIHEDSSLAENTQDICITYSEEIDSLLKKVSKLTSTNMDHSTSAGEEEPAAEGAGSDETLETTRTGAWPADHELGGETCLGTRANCAVTPVSRKGLCLHQQRELRNLGLLTSPMVSDAEVSHEKENTMEYALVGETEHRSDGAQEHRMEVYLDYALDTRNPLSEHGSDGEVITIPNIFKEAMGSPQVTKWKEATNKEMGSLQKHAVFNLVSPTQYHRSTR